MRILFLHPNFPAQFRHLATALAADPRNQVVFGTSREEGELPSVHKVLYGPSRQAHAEVHPYLGGFENAVLQGQAVYRLVSRLKEFGFVPDLVYGHSGWGPTLYIKDALPDVRLVCYFEWFYRACGSDVDFDPSDPASPDTLAQLRIKNAPILMDLAACDLGISPTIWQHSQFPAPLRSKIAVLHDGVDTGYFRPRPSRLVLPRLGLDLSEVEELVTYVARGMEPYRGFPQLIEALWLLQQRRPHCHAVIVGDDRVAYGRALPKGQSYKELMLAKFPLDLARVHFTGLLPYGEYLQVLQASSAHVYLTRPFVLSWSMLEAMAAGCLLIASDTPPVSEVIQDGVNGWLVDFFAPEEIAERLDEALERPEWVVSLRTHARRTIERFYDLQRLLPLQIARLQRSLATG
ncbi:glycosyltransferase family 4 protein [Gloeobacter morelensis]|uniref:Glycosyltransferase family 4 protein n=1 Tax=Gloeobacter morelensis MG652769 TaxID=2781736 RepID=A0ABY3PK48_9CYAN|nr:glycosyltransferase family 4 protein [Gloeobacter morelensis]UFP94001.1 glycosyltransferase family 4 protein [Gloeobacter morelensis MG652769]